MHPRDNGQTASLTGRWLTALRGETLVGVYQCVLSLSLDLSLELEVE